MSYDNANEIFPVVDETGRVVGSSTRGKCHGGSMLLHPVVYLYVFNSRGELYLQHRPLWKDIQPGRWDTAAGGHIDRAESVEEDLRREVREELGIVGFEAQFVGMYEFRSERERELIYVFRTAWDGEICPGEELEEGRFWSVAEIGQQLGQGVFTPNFEGEVGMVLA